MDSELAAARSTPAFRSPPNIRAREITLEIDSRDLKTLGAREVALENDSRNSRAYVAREFMQTVCSQNRNEDRERRLSKTLTQSTRIDTLIQSR